MGFLKPEVDGPITLWRLVKQIALGVLLFIATLMLFGSSAPATAIVLLGWALYARRTGPITKAWEEQSEERAERRRGFQEASLRAKEERQRRRAERAKRAQERAEEDAARREEAAREAAEFRRSESARIKARATPPEPSFDPHYCADERCSGQHAHGWHSNEYVPHSHRGLGFEEFGYCLDCGRDQCSC